MKDQIDELTSTTLNNTNQLKESALIKSIIEHSLTTIINSNITGNSENSDNINNNLLEIDLAVKEMKLILDNLTVNFKQTVNNEINKQSKEIIDTSFTEVSYQRFNDMLENNKKLLVEAVESTLSNTFNVLYEEKIAEEQYKKQKDIEETEKIKLEEEALAKELVKQQEKLEEEALAKELIEQQKKLEEALSKELLEQQKKLEEEKIAKELVEQQKKLEEEALAAELIEQQKKLQEEDLARIEEERLRIEKEAIDADRQDKENKILIEIIKEDIVVYPSTPFTLFAFVEGLDINNSIIGVFVKEGDTYELRGRTNDKSFDLIDGKTSVTINIQLSGNETSLIIKGFNNILLTPKNNINDSIVELIPGTNNFINISSLPIIQF